MFHFSPLLSSASAQTPTPANTNPNVSNDPHFSTQSTIIEIMSAITCQLTGLDPINPKQSCLGVDQKSGKIGFLPQGSTPNGAGGAIGVMGNMISMLYTPPIHTRDYFQNLAQDFGITKKTYAEGERTGTGFDSIKPLLSLWKAFRNIVYLVFVIVFVVIGVAIMLRIKIDPRTVMTIQNQIPKIIVGILMVTFSLAIAGFLIDLMWTLIYLVYGIIVDVQVNNVAVDVTQLNPTVIQGKNALGAFGGLGGIFGIAKTSSASISTVLTNEFFSGTTGRIVAGIIGALIGAFGPNSWLGSAGITPDVAKVKNIEAVAATGICSIVSFASGGLGGILCNGIANTAIKLAVPAATAGLASLFSDKFIGFIANTLAFIIISVAMLWALVRLWFTLLISYVYILLDIVLAPFWIIAGIIPGSPISFSGWIRNLSANLLAFPATIALFLIGTVFMKAFEDSGNGANFVPPLIGNPGGTKLISSILGLGIIFITPNIVTVLKNILKAPKLDTGGGFAKAIGVGFATPKSAISSVFEYQRKVPKPGDKGGFGSLFGRVFGR